jgi:hypothetical protein
MKRLLIAGLFLVAMSTRGHAQGALAGVNGDCVIGGQQALTQGLPSTGTQQIGTTNVNAGAGVMASFPMCQITVYLTGTTTKPNIYSDNNAPPTSTTNPFTANNDGSFTFFAAQGLCYDITISTGTGPVLPYPRTLSDVCLGTGGSGPGGGIQGATVGGGLVVDITGKLLGNQACPIGDAQVEAITGWICGLPGANPSVSFTNVTSVSLATNFSTLGVIPACWDNNIPAIAFYPDKVAFSQTSGVATFYFAVPQSGTCTMNGSGSFGNGGGGTITGATAGGGLVQNSTTLGLGPCSLGQVLQSQGGGNWDCGSSGAPYVIYANLLSGGTPDAQITLALATAQTGQEIDYNCTANAVLAPFANPVIINVAVLLKLGGCQYQSPPNGPMFTGTVPGIHIDCTGKLLTTLYSSYNYDVIHMNPTVQNDWEVSNCGFTDNIPNTRTAGSAIYEDTGIATVNTQNASSGSCPSNCVIAQGANDLSFTGLTGIVTIAGGSFTIGTVYSSTLMSLTTAPGTQTGVTLTTLIASARVSIHDILTYGFEYALNLQGLNDSKIRDAGCQVPIKDCFNFPGPGNTVTVDNGYALGISSPNAGFRFTGMNASGITGGQCSVNGGTANCVVSQGTSAFCNSGFWTTGLDSEVGTGYTGTGDGILLLDVCGAVLNAGDSIGFGGSGVHTEGGTSINISGMRIANNGAYGINAGGTSPLGNVTASLQGGPNVFAANTSTNYNDPNNVVTVPSKWYHGTATCSSSTKTVTYPAAYEFTPTVTVSDQTTSGGAKAGTPGTSTFVVTCSGASDVFSWTSYGNPD